MSELAAEVRQRADHRCEYCLLPQALFRRTFHIEHIIARQHGGVTGLDNLALACWQCNLKKGPSLSGIDSQTGVLVRLFHPRQDRWAEHFELQESSTARERIEIIGLTPAGSYRAFARYQRRIEAINPL